MLADWSADCSKLRCGASKIRTCGSLLRLASPGPAHTFFQLHASLVKCFIPDSHFPEGYGSMSITILAGMSSQETEYLLNDTGSYESPRGNRLINSSHLSQLPCIQTKNNHVCCLFMINNLVDPSMARLPFRKAVSK